MFAFSAKTPAKQDDGMGDLSESGRLDELLITHEGYMTEHVDGFFGSGWKRQYYVLGKGKVYTYPNQQTHKAKNAIDLDGYMVQLIEDRKMLKKLNRQSEVCLFTLTHPEKAKYIFAADSEEDMTEWIEAIMLEMFRDQPVVVHEDPPDVRAAEELLHKARQGRERKATTSSILVAHQNLNADDDDRHGKHGGSHGHGSGAHKEPHSPKPATSSTASTASTGPGPAHGKFTKPAAAAPDAAAIEAQIRAKIQKEHDDKEKQLKAQIESERRAEEERRKQADKLRAEREREMEEKEKAIRAELERMRSELERKEKELIRQREEEADKELKRIEAQKQAEIARMEGEAKKEAERREKERAILEKKRKKQEAMEEANRLREERERQAKLEAEKAEAELRKREEEEKQRVAKEEQERLQREKEREARLKAEQQKLEEEKMKAEKEAERVAKVKEIELRKQQQEEEERARKEKEDGDSGGEKCPNCNKKRLGTEKFCIDCGAQFSDGGKPESNEKKKPNLPLPSPTGAPQSPSGSVSEKKNFGGGVEGVIAQLDDINKRYEALTMEDAVNGVGTMLYDELKETLTKIKQLRLLLDSVAQYDFNKNMQKTLEELKGCVHLYNRLNKAIPFKVNQFVQKYQNQQATNPETQVAADTCSTCGQKLTGQTVEAVGGFFHLECFKCYGCGTKFQNTCLNIDGKPYCDTCGRKAFVQSKLRAMGGAGAS